MSLMSCNPISRYFFTSDDYQDNIYTIESLLKEYESGTCNEKKQHLEKIYSYTYTNLLYSGNKSRPDKHLCFFLSEILRHCSLLYLESNFNLSKQLLLAGLSIQFYNIGIVGDCFPIADFKSLDKLKSYLESNPALFFLTQELIKTTDKNLFINNAYFDSIALSNSSKRLRALAETAYWLGYCYQGTEDEGIAQKLFEIHKELFLIIA